ncbi:MAG TPA: hypothetical protein VD902_07915 [Symbiobacteriaceae bacterium]|nr:hypothetical protein [Symbiobacteriaceae bacterium]
MTRQTSTADGLIPIDFAGYRDLRSTELSALERAARAEVTHLAKTYPGTEALVANSDWVMLHHGRPLKKKDMQEGPYHE